MSQSVYAAAMISTAGEESCTEQLCAIFLSDRWFLQQDNLPVSSEHTRRGTLCPRVWPHIFFARFLGLWVKTGEVPIKESGECEA